MTNYNYDKFIDMLTSSLYDTKKFTITSTHLNYLLKDLDFLSGKIEIDIFNVKEPTVCWNGCYIAIKG